MNLEEIADGDASIALPLIGGDKALTREIQRQLSAIGLLDPPTDDVFGPVSQWALTQLLRAMGESSKTAVDKEVAQALMAGSNSTLFKLNAPNTLAGRIVSAVLANEYWLCRHPDCINIIYVEGLDADGNRNEDAPNKFNDLRIVLNINRSGNPQIMGSWDATTEPGRYYTLIERLDPRGAARIAFGQYKAWSVGTHMAGRPSAHEALVQTAPIRVFRDLNADFERLNDKTDSGLFGINQHWGYDLPKGDIGRASAGCLVGRTKLGHRSFMSLCKEDPRYSASHSYRFMTTVLDAASIPS